MPSKMIRIHEGSFSRADWNSVVSKFEDLTLLQTWEYGEAASRTRSLEVRRMLFLQGETVVGAGQAFCRTLPFIRGGLVWINRGPLWKQKDSDYSTFVALMRSLRDYWVAGKGMVLRIAPAMKPEEIQEPFGKSVGYGFVKTARPWFSARLDLTKSLDELRSSIRPNWAASLRKAESFGITVQSGTTKTRLNVVKAGLKELLNKRQFKSPITPEFLQAFQNFAEEGQKLLCFTASSGSKSLGGIVLARYGAVCEYLAGAISEDGKKRNAGQLLLWSAVVQAKETGYKRFDLGGMDPELTNKGVLYFKSGLHGEPYQLVGDFEAYSGGLVDKAIRWRLERALRHLSGNNVKGVPVRQT